MISNMNLPAEVFSAVIQAMGSPPLAVISDNGEILFNNKEFLQDDDQLEETIMMDHNVLMLHHNGRQRKLERRDWKTPDQSGTVVWLSESPVSLLRNVAPEQHETDDEQAQQMRALQDENQLIGIQAWHVLLNAIPAAALVISTTGEIIYQSKTMNECFGAARPRKWKHIDELAAETREAYAANGVDYPEENYPLARSVKNGEVVRGEKMLITRGDGSQATLRVSASPIYNKDHKIERAVAFLEDTTAEAAMEKQLRILQDQETSLSQLKAKSRFVANTSHEIRTPAAGLLGLSEIMLSTNLLDDQREIAKSMQESAQRLVRIINTFLDFSKLEAHQAILDETSIRPLQLLNELQTIYNKIAQQKNAIVQVKLDDNVPAVIEADLLKITQVISNLCDNAIKFSPPGSLVDLECSIVDEKWVQMAVKDSGIGISQADAQHIFDPFSQADGTTTRLYGGLGLGLALSRDLAQLMEGSLEYIFRKDDVGALFRFKFPLKEPQVSSLLQLPPLEHRRSGSPIAGSSRSDSNSSSDFSMRPEGRTEPVRILVAEDDRVNSMIIERFLSQAGFDIEMTVNGRSALDKYKEEQGKFDVVLLDCMMPILDGYQTAMEIGAYEKVANLSPTPIAAISANCTTEDKAKCIAAGMEYFIGKPFSAKQLYQCLDEILSAARLRRMGEVALEMDVE